MELREYLQALKKIKTLEPEEEQRLWCAYKESGDAEARRILIESYQPLVFKAVLSFKHADNVMDIVQEGTVGLIEAVENFDYRRGVAFSLYALHRIRGRMLNFLQKEGARDLTYVDKPMYNNGVEGTLGENLVDPAPAIAEQAEDNFLADELQSALQKLPPKERSVLRGVYLQQREPKEMARSLSVSTSHIYRLQKQGIRRIRGMLSKLMQHW